MLSDTHSYRRSFYYLLNFERALAWLSSRYSDLLDPDEQTFVTAFAALPSRSRALLVRMLMRKGTVFRASRLSYAEIGCPLQAAQPLVALGWLEADPAVDASQAGALLARAELQALVSGVSPRASARKADLIDALRAVCADDTQRCSRWGIPDTVLRVTIAALCERLRLMFFGNLQQTWAEFVLADLGVYRYEAVSFEPSARAFQQRADIDAYVALAACRDTFDRLAASGAADAPAELTELLARLASIDIASAWVETRRDKLRYRLGYRAEQLAAWPLAIDAYTATRWPDARYRHARVLERCGRFEEALALARCAEAAPESEAEHQRIARMLARLQRRLGLPAPRARAALPIERDTLLIERPDERVAIEHAVRDHLHHCDAPTYYVENALINALFGLLCWEAIFAPLPGAFFHPFQRGPADLNAPDFRTRRAEHFERCFAELDSGAYRTTIERHMREKSGIQSPFVAWHALTPELIALALELLPAEHLKRCFERLVGDIRGNRAGLPDLVRFMPAERRYEFIEIKGPGDRLQDNQIRWLAYCARHGIPVRVLDVRWRDAAGDLATGAGA